MQAAAIHQWNTVKDPGPEEFERWVTQTAEGNARARDELIAALWIRLERQIMRLPQVRDTGMALDCARDVTLIVVDRLAQDGLAHEYLQWKRSQGVSDKFLNWVTRVAENEAKDYMRRLVGRAQPAKAAAAPLASAPAAPTPPAAEASAEPERLPSRKGLLNLFTKYLTEQHHPSTRPPYTNIQTVNELLQYARRELEPRQLEVLDLWLNDHSSQQIEAAMQLPPGAAEALRRAAIARLRRRFVETAEGSGD